MNKELIKKYKEEFNYWLNGGVLLFKWSHEEPSCWLREDDVISNNLWCHKESNIKYIIIKDEYVEFRIALAEGKIVEYSKSCLGIRGQWNKVTTILPGTDDKPSDYRIKPEEPQFKVGDWVRDSRDNNLKQVVNPNSPAALSDYIKWKPQPGEWCWFFNKDRIPTISQFVEMEEEKYFASYPNKHHQLGSWYKYCEPFIGTLPTYLKE